MRLRRYGGRKKNKEKQSPRSKALIIFYYVIHGLEGWSFTETRPLNIEGSFSGTINSDFMSTSVEIFIY